MKLISILGSPRGIKGYRASLVRCMLDTVQNAGAETELFSLADLPVHPCKVCLEVCHIKGLCHLKCSAFYINFVFNRLFSGHWRGSDNTTRS